MTALDFFCICELISLLSALIIPVFEMNELFGEQDFFKTNISWEPSFLFTIIVLLKALLKNLTVCTIYPQAIRI